MMGHIQSHSFEPSSTRKSENTSHQLHKDEGRSGERLGINVLPANYFFNTN